MTRMKSGNHTSEFEVKEALQAGTILNDDNVVFKPAKHGVFAGMWDRIDGNPLRVAKAPNEPIDLLEVNP